MVGEIRPFLLYYSRQWARALDCVCQRRESFPRSIHEPYSRVCDPLRARATTRRVLRQLLTESTLLAVAGGALGLLLATWGRKLYLVSSRKRFRVPQKIRLDGRVLLSRSLFRWYREFFSGWHRH